MNNAWTPYIVLSALAASALGIFIWNRKRKNFMKVGRISKLYFFPVKSLKAVEVTHGKCTKFGFEVDGLLDRSFMLVNEDGLLVSQRQEPSLVLLTPEIKGNYLTISSLDNIKPLKVEIKKSPSPNDKILNCKVHRDAIDGVDCGDEAASWFQSYLGKKDIRLVRYFSACTIRKYTMKDAFYTKFRKDNPVGFPDLAPLHVLSQPSVDDLNSRIQENKVSALNFRPNILIDHCDAYAEDSWKYLKFQNEVELENLILITRCLMTTNDPETGTLTQKEPILTLRKYRITSDPELTKILGSIPCLGIGCSIIFSGEIKVNDEVFAVVGKQPKMKEKGV